jgi:hypothetical protein
MWKESDSSNKSEEVELYVGVSGVKEPTELTTELVLVLSCAREWAY